MNADFVSGGETLTSSPLEWNVGFIVVVVTVIAVSICVTLHYEALTFLTRRLAHRQGRRRPRVLLGIFGVLAVHVAEIWIFGIAAFFLLLSPKFGTLHGIVDPTFLDHIYLSAMTYTTVGFGDVYPGGPIRFLSGTEALTGLVLVSWSASFTFLEMERFWRDK